VSAVANKGKKKKSQRSKTGDVSKKVRPIRADLTKDAAVGVSSNKVALWIEDAKKFLSEVKVEFGKIAWPTRKEAIGLTVAVLAITVFFTAFLGLVDISLSKIIGLLIY